LNTTVLQGSVLTCLRCEGLFSDQFITPSLLSPKVKKFWKSDKICWSYGQLSTVFIWINEKLKSLQWHVRTTIHMNITQLKLQK